MTRFVLPFFALALFVVTNDISAQAKDPPLVGTLEASKKGWVKLTVTNKSDKPVHFVDVREGTAACYDVWRVEAQLENKKSVPKAIAIYSPAGFPNEVTLKPGQKHTREFQLVAYLNLAGQEGKTVNVIVHYEVDPDYFKLRTKAPHVRFSSAPLRLKLER